MIKNVLIILINSNSLDSTLATLDEVENKYTHYCQVLLIDNGSVEEQTLKIRSSSYSCVSEYVNFADTYDVGVVLNKIKPLLDKHACSNLFFIYENHQNVVSYMPILMSLSKVSNNYVLGIRGGSIFSAFFHNVLFFQNNTSTDWLDFNGMFIQKNIWLDQRDLNLHYYKGFSQVDFGFQLLKNGFKLFKLKTFSFTKTGNLDGYFRMRNPFLFLNSNYGSIKYLWGGLYLMIQLPFSTIMYFKDRGYLNGLFDGIKLLTRFPRSTS